MHQTLVGDCCVFFYGNIILFLEPGRGIVLCMEKALAQSGIAREDVNYINAHATSSPAGDLKEHQAITRCFGKNPKVS